MSMNRIVIVTVAWGEWHLNAMQRTTLASLLAPGNLPIFVKEFDITYHIHLRKSEAKGFTQSPIYQKLTKIVDVVILTTVPEIDEGDPFTLHHIAWHRGIEAAKRLGALVMFMPPDVVFADQSWSFLRGPLNAGKKAILWTYSRVIEETILPELMAPVHWPNDNQLIISKRELVQMSFEHFHPLMMSCMYGSQNFVQHPEMVMWPVDGEGVSMRILASVNAIYDPSYFALNKNNLLDGGIDTDDIFFVTDSDQLFSLSLGPYAKDGHWYCAQQQAEHWRIGRWWESFDSPSNDFIASQKIRIHHVEVTESKWRAVEQSADLALTRCAYYREAYRVTKTLIKPNFTFIAGVIEHLAINDVLPRHIKPNTQLVLLALTNMEFNELLYTVSANSEANKTEITVDDFIAALKRITFYLKPNENVAQWLIDEGPKYALSGHTYHTRKRDGNVYVNDYEVRDVASKPEQHHICTVLLTKTRHDDENASVGLDVLLTRQTP